MRLPRFISGRSEGMGVVAETFVVFLAAGALLALVQLPGRFPDADAFYHAKMALLSLGGPVREFSWLPFTVLSGHYADHHYLFHLIIAPFVYWGGMAWGLKSVMVILGAAAVSSFHLLLRRLGVRHAWLFSFLLVTSGPVLQRLSLVKATALSLTVLFWALWAMRRDRRLVLFVLSFAYVWSYGGWPILGVVAFFDVASSLLVGRGGRLSLSDSLNRRGVDLEEVKSSLLRLVSVCCGLLAGLVVNPFFPENVRFYWEQVVQVAVLGHGPSVVPGVEWLPFTPLGLFRNVSVVVIAWSLFGAVYLVTVFWPSVRRKSTGRSFGDVRFMVLSWLFTVFTLGMALMSRRHVEYLVPVSLISLAVTSSFVFHRLDLKITVELLERVFARRWMVWVTPCAFAGFVVLMAFRSVGANMDIQGKGYPVDYLSRIGRQVEREVPAGAVVFNAAWEDFPALFLASESHVYVSGLDPNFLNRSDERLSGLYSGLACGRLRGNVSSVIRDDFKANFAVIPAGHPLSLWVSGDEEARLLYADEEAELWFLGSKE